MTKRQPARAGLAALALLLALPLRHAIAQAPEYNVVISEIGWAGSGLSSADEWIELTNLTETDLNLSGWTLAGSATSGAALALPDATIIEAHSTLLIANFSEEDARSTLSATPNVVTPSLALSNSALQLALTRADGSIADQAGDGTTPAAGSSAAGAILSMARVFPITDGTHDDAWADAVEADGFDDGATELGTPGRLEVSAFPHAPVSTESVDPTPVEPAPLPNIPNTNTSSEPEPAVEPVETGTCSMMSEPTEPDAEPEPLEEPTEPAEQPPMDVPETADIPSEPTTEEPVDLEPVTEPTPETDENVTNEPTGEIVEPESSDASETPTSTSDNETTTPVEEAPAATPVPTNTPQPAPTCTCVSTQSPAVPSPAVPVTTPVSTTSVVPVSFAAGRVLINEFVSDPVSGDPEWVELYNPFSDAVSLDGWHVRDASGKLTALPAQSLLGGGLFVLEDPAGKLNNDGDSIELLDPSGRVIDTVTYGTSSIPAVSDPNALARTSSGDWVETDRLTPGAANLFPAATSPTTTTAAVSTTASPAANTTTTNAPTTTGTTPIVQPVELPSVVAYTLRLSELYPSTLGGDTEEEYVEIENTSEITLPLGGVSLMDASGKTFTFGEEILAAHAHLAVLRPTSGITLNNDADTLILRAPDETVLDQVTYANAKKGETYALVNGAWAWTTPTPNAANIAAAVAPTTVASTATSTHKTTAKKASVAATSVTSAEAKLFEDDAKVQLHGTIASLPGALGRQILYLLDATGGIQLYQYSAEFPTLALGDVVDAVGVMSTSHGERRVKLSGVEDLVVASHGEVPTAGSLSLEAVDATHVGELLRTEGFLAKRSGAKLTIESNGTQLLVNISEGTGIDAASFPLGARLSVTGLLSVSDGSLRLLPRAPEDMTVLDETGAEATAAQSTPASAAKNSSAMGELLIAGSAAVLLGFALRRALPSLTHWYANRGHLGLATEKTD